MPAQGREPVFKGTVANGETKYVGAPISGDRCGMYIAWLDATSAATITLELTSFNPGDAPIATAGTYQWKDSGLTITGPTGSAAGASMLNLSNIGQRAGRLKIVASAACSFEIYAGL